MPLFQAWVKLSPTSQKMLSRQSIKRLLQRAPRHHCVDQGAEALAFEYRIIEKLAGSCKPIYGVVRNVNNRHLTHEEVEEVPHYDS